MLQVVGRVNMERIFQLYERTTWHSFLRHELLSLTITVILFIILILGLVLLFGIDGRTYASILSIIFLILMSVMVKSKTNRNQRLYPLENNLRRLIHYSLIEKRTYWTMHRFAKFYHDLGTSFSNSSDLLSAIRDTRNHLQEIIKIFDAMEKIIDAPRRYLRYWAFGIAISAILGLTYKLVGDKAHSEVLVYLASEFIAIFLIFFVYSVFCDKYYNRKYKIIELYNFIVCAETLTQLESNN